MSVYKQASLKMKRLGVISMLVVALEILLMIILDRSSFIQIFSTAVCFTTAIWDFAQARKWNKMDKEYQNAVKNN